MRPIKAEHVEMVKFRSGGHKPPLTLFEEWKVDNPEAIILDIQYSSTGHGSGNYLSDTLLIIYSNSQN